MIDSCRLRIVCSLYHYNTSSAFINSAHHAATHFCFVNVTSSFWRRGNGEGEEDSGYFCFILAFRALVSIGKARRGTSNFAPSEHGHNIYCIFRLFDRENLSRDIAEE